MSAVEGQRRRNAHINVNNGHHQDSEIDLGLSWRALSLTHTHTYTHAHPHVKSWTLDSLCWGDNTHLILQAKKPDTDISQFQPLQMPWMTFHRRKWRNWGCLVWIQQNVMRIANITQKWQAKAICTWLQQGTVHDNSYCTLSAVQVQHVFSDYGAILPDLLVLLPAVSRWSISCLLVLPACYLRVEVCSCFLLLLWCCAAFTAVAATATSNSDSNSSGPIARQRAADAIFPSILECCIGFTMFYWPCNSTTGPQKQAVRILRHTLLHILVSLCHVPRKGAKPQAKPVLFQRTSTLGWL